MNEKILQIITIVSQALVVIIWFFSSFLNEKKKCIKLNSTENVLSRRLTTSMSWDREKSKRTSVGSEWFSEGLAIGLYSLSRSLTSLYSASSAITTPIHQ